MLTLIIDAYFEFWYVNIKLYVSVGAWKHNVGMSPITNNVRPIEDDRTELRGLKDICNKAF